MNATLHKPGVPGGRSTIAQYRRQHIDPYRRRRRPSQPSACRKCGAVFHEDGWAWSSGAVVATQTLCPACTRIANRCPASILRIHGQFLKALREEVLALVLREEKAEVAQHPLGRIMDICDRPDEIEIAATDMRLVRRFISALTSTFGGRARLEYDTDHYFLMASWSRDS